MTDITSLKSSSPEGTSSLKSTFFEGVDKCTFIEPFMASKEVELVKLSNLNYPNNSNTNPLAKNVIEQILILNPLKRPSISTIIDFFNPTLEKNFTELPLIPEAPLKQYTGDVKLSHRSIRCHVDLTSG